MPVPGTMTSVSWETLQDPTLVFGIPVIGYRLPDGSYLENSQLEPDIKVANSPETVVKGEYTQLKAAERDRRKIRRKKRYKQNRKEKQQVFFFRFLFVGTFTEYPLFIYKRSSLFSYLAITR